MDVQMIGRLNDRVSPRMSTPNDDFGPEAASSSMCLVRI